MDQHDTQMTWTQAPRIAQPRSVQQMLRAGLIIEEEGRTRLGDEFRIAASRVQRVLTASLKAGAPGANVLLVTSTRPSEGKSFSAINMASALAQTASRPVLLIDADAKRGSLSDLMGMRGERGLLDLTADAALAPGSLMVSTPVHGLSILPLGDIANVGEPTGRAQPLLNAAEQLSRTFPNMTLVIDTGPLLATSDPSVIAPIVGQILMVVEAERTQRSEMEAALEMIRGCPNVMLLLNKVAGHRRTQFGAYSYTGEYYAKPNLPPPRPDKE